MLRCSDEMTNDVSLRTIPIIRRYMTVLMNLFFWNPKKTYETFFGEHQNGLPIYLFVNIIHHLWSISLRNTFLKFFLSECNFGVCETLLALILLIFPPDLSFFLMPFQFATLIYSPHFTDASEQMTVSMITPFSAASRSTVGMQ